MTGMEMSTGLHGWPATLDTHAEKKDHIQLHSAALESLVFCMVDESGVSRSWKSHFLVTE